MDGSDFMRLSLNDNTKNNLQAVYIFTKVASDPLPSEVPHKQCAQFMLK